MEKVNPDSVFKRDLEKGLKHEQIVLGYIQQKYPLTVAMKGKWKEFDLWVPEVDMGIEVKSDEKSQETGNLVVEIEFGGKPSALSTTKAKYWVIWDGIEYSWLKVSEIWRCIEENNYRVATFTGRGDRTAKRAYLIPKEELWEYRSSTSNIE